MAENNALSGQVAIVTGASRGIGADIARVLAREGMTVIACARTMEEGDFHIPGSLRSTVDSINSAGGKAVAYRCDLSKEEQINELWEFAVREFSHVDALVNNAAIAVPGTIETMSWRHFHLNLVIDVVAPVLLSRLAVAHMRQLGRGAIVNISSGASRGPGRGPYKRTSVGGTPYGLSKAALERFTQGLASELWEDNISVNAMSPARQIYVGGTIYVTQTNPTYSVGDLAGKRKDGTIMGDACAAIFRADRRQFTGVVSTDEGVLTELTGIKTFDHYATY
ncbi:MAG: SDR family NAD(P)-dependent oxidoreductase [Dehalococcoidia bacterium]|nr:SDR family NAD(P)-dependent oxidoreductase [Dehalococcoidia bacterium]